MATKIYLGADKIEVLVNGVRQPIGRRNRSVVEKVHELITQYDEIEKSTDIVEYIRVGWCMTRIKFKTIKFKVDYVVPYAKYEKVRITRINWPWNNPDQYYIRQIKEDLGIV